MVVHGRCGCVLLVMVALVVADLAWVVSWCWVVDRVVDRVVDLGCAGLLIWAVNRVVEVVVDRLLGF